MAEQEDCQVSVRCRSIVAWWAVKVLIVSRWAVMEMFAQINKSGILPTGRNSIKLDIINGPLFYGLHKRN